MAPRLVLIAAAVVALSACGGQLVRSTATVAAAQLYSGAHCTAQAERSSAAWITAKSEFRRAHAGLFGWQLGAEPPAPPSIDFMREAVLLLAMGPRPTAGYRVKLAEKRVPVDDGVAAVPVFWREPAPDSYQAQVLTHPCVLIKLPRSGYERLRVLDQDGTARFELPAPQ